MVIGFTGTRQGMSDAQKDQLDWVLAMLAPSPARPTRDIRTKRLTATVAFHHGGAKGADAEAAALAARYIGPDRIVSHPPADHTPKAALLRDRDIVKVADVLIAAPRGDKEELRSGTWATVRYAREEGIPVIMLSRGRS